MIAQHRNFSQTLTVGAGSSSEVTLILSGINNYHEVEKILVQGGNAGDLITIKYTENNNILTWDSADITFYQVSNNQGLGGAGILRSDALGKGLTIKENQKLIISITNNGNAQATYKILVSAVQFTR